MNILGLIPARGGSKSIPQKSIYPLHGKPLMYYTIRAAKDSRLITRLVLSTDDPEMAAVGKKYGAEVPFMRPKKLAADTTPDLPVFKHTLQWLEKNEGYRPDIIVQLRPTSPFKSGADIDRAVQLLIDNPRADSVRSISIPAQTPFKMLTIGKHGLLRPLLPKAFPEVFRKYKEPFNTPRQALPAIWEYSGYIDVLRWATIMKKNSMSGSKALPFTTEEWRNLDIDSMRELQYAEILFKNRKK